MGVRSKGMTRIKNGADVMKKMLIDELHKALDELEEIDRTIMEMYSKNHSEAEIGQAIGMSQKGVNKRKHKVLLKLNTRLKDFKYFNSRTHVECDEVLSENHLTECRVHYQICHCNQQANSSLYHYFICRGYKS